MSDSISNMDDLIDSRDVIARIDELESEIAASEISEDNGATAQHDEDGNVIVKMATCGTCGKSWNDALITGTTPAPSVRCPYEYLHQEIDELKALKVLAEEAEGYAPGWRHGESLIRDSYFEQYAEELADDIGAIKDGTQWPYTCIDWEKAARELRMDYTAVEFGDVTYWIR